MKREDTAQRKRTWNWQSGPRGADLCVCSLKGPEIRVEMRAKEELSCIPLTDAPLSGTCMFLLHWPGGPVSGPTQWNRVLGCVDTRHEKKGTGGNLQSLLRTLEKCQIPLQRKPELSHFGLKVIPPLSCLVSSCQPQYLSVGLSGKIAPCVAPVLGASLPLCPPTQPHGLQLPGLS